MAGSLGFILGTFSLGTFFILYFASLGWIEEIQEDKKAEAAVTKILLPFLGKPIRLILDNLLSFLKVLKVNFGLDNLGIAYNLMNIYMRSFLRLFVATCISALVETFPLRDWDNLTVAISALVIDLIMKEII